jgi:hypothetical protein
MFCYFLPTILHTERPNKIVSNRCDFQVELQTNKMKNEPRFFDEPNVHKNLELQTCLNEYCKFA